MRIDLKKLRSLMVETKSGMALGHVKNIILETEAQNVMQYEVGGLLGKKYLVGREQVISFDEKKMIVEDNVIVLKNGEIMESGKIMIEPGGAMMDEIGN